METADRIAEPTTAQNMVALLLKMAGPDLERQEKALCEGLTRTQAGVKGLQEQRLAYVERGAEQAWQNQYDLKTALVAEITRVLAERFGR